jgi:hypothetical protein
MPNEECAANFRAWRDGGSREDGVDPEIFYFIRYVFTASLGITLIEVLHRNRRALAREATRRARSERTLIEAEARLKTHAQELER